MLINLVRLLAGTSALLLWLLARGAQTRPHPPDQLVGLFLHLAAVGLVFYIFFFWKKTSLRAPSFARHKWILVSLYALCGAVIITSVFWLLSFGTYGGQIEQYLVSNRYADVDLVVNIAVGIIALVVAVGISLNAPWSQMTARVAAFPLSIGWPFGLLLAIYTWWAYSGNKSTNNT